MTMLERLNLSYVRATTQATRDYLLTQIDALLEKTTCPACGLETEEGTCWNLYCPEGLDNIQAEMGDAEYHAGVDRDVEAYYLEMDR